VNKIIKYGFFSLLFFPSITFGLLPSEIFPWAIIFSILYIKKCIVEFFFISLLFLSPIVIGLFSNVDLLEIVRSLFAYYNALLILYVVIRLNGKNLYELINVLKISLSITIIIGLTQYLINNALFDFFVNVLVPRAKTSVDSSRGVSGLSSEPSRQAIEIIIMYTTLIAINNKIWFKNYINEIILAAYIILVNRSTTGIAFLLIFLLIRFLYTKKIYYIPFLISIFLFFNLINLDVLLSFRGVNVLSQFSSISNIQNLLTTLINYSGFRLSGIFSAYLNPTLLGYGIGNIVSGSLEGMLANPFLYKNVWYFTEQGLSGVRSPAFFAGLLIESGVICTVSVVLLIAKNFPRELFKRNIIKKYYTIPIIFSLLFIGSIGSPIPFICLGIIINYYNQLSYINS